MEFPHTYFMDEVRDGFYVSGLMKRYWAAQLEVLAEIDKVCRKYDITWYADFGTLLGAVRHKGFVPWDDDIDICMMRDDYMRFNEIAEKELPQSYVVLNIHKNEVYYDYVTRVTNEHGLNFEREYLDKYHECPYAVGIDIFSLDKISPDEKKEEKRKQTARRLMKAANDMPFDNSDSVRIQEIFETVKDICHIDINSPKPVRQQLFEEAEHLFTIFNDESAAEVACMGLWISINKYKYPISCFDKVLRMPFEVTEISVSAEWDEILKIEYGDYMQIQKGGSDHEYPLYKEQEEFFMGLVKTYPFQYKFKKEDLEKGSPLSKQGLKADLKLFIASIGQAHNIHMSMLQSGNYNICLEMLEKCHANANGMGERIENEYGEGHITVRVLEEYLELLYNIHQMLLEGPVSREAAEIIGESLKEILDKITHSLEKNIFDRKTIVFLPVRACCWGAMEDMWERAVGNSECDVYVIPIPYYEKGAKGEQGKMFYEGNEFPDNVKITDYKDFDLSERHPDVIIIQNPYDECNYTFSVAPEFYSRNLKNSTEMLVYVPYFVLDEFTPDDDRAMYTMRYFCTVPGVVNADKVILQSAQMRDRYIECLTKFAGTNTRKIWEEKIAVK